MALYPSLEDMKVGQMMQAQLEPFPGYPTPSTVPIPIPIQLAPGHASAPFPSAPSPSPFPSASAIDSAYPALFDMGLSLTPEEIALITSGPVAVRAPTGVAAIGTVATGNTAIGTGVMIAPLSGGSVGLRRAAVTHGIRQVTLCKGSQDKVGMRVAAISKGIFVVFVQSNSPAAMVGLRFGDQILEINGVSLAGFSMDKVHNMIKKGPVNGIQISIRDRPFERTITLHKDSTGSAGFLFKHGRINAIVKDSSAARNGLLIDHNLLEVNGQNVVGLEDKAVRAIIDGGGDIITLTIIPSVIYDHLIKHTSSSMIKKLMDHSIPDL